MIYQRPKLNIFAESAKAGEVVSFPDWARGWGITIEQTNSKPPMQWMNDALKQLNTHSLYLLQNGGYEWDKALEYPVGAKAQINNLIYIAKVKNTNVSPEGNTDTWLVYGLQTSAISQLLDGTSKIKIASEDALRRVNVTAEKGVSEAKVAKDKADLVGIQANQNTANLGKKVNLSGDTMTGALSVQHQAPAYRMVNTSIDPSRVGSLSYITNEGGKVKIVKTQLNSPSVFIDIELPERSGVVALTSDIIKDTSLNESFGWARNNTTMMGEAWGIRAVMHEATSEVTLPFEFKAIRHIGATIKEKTPLGGGQSAYADIVNNGRIILVNDMTGGATRTADVWWYVIGELK